MRNNTSVSSSVCIRNLLFIVYFILSALYLRGTIQARCNHRLVMDDEANLLAPNTLAGQQHQDQSERRDTHCYQGHKAVIFQIPSTCVWFFGSAIHGKRWVPW